MLQEFVLVSFAGFIGWQVFRYFSFFSVNFRTAPFLVFGMCFGLTYFFVKPSIIIALSAAGGVAILNKIADASSPEPLRIPKFRKISRKKNQSEVPLPDKIGHRIPMLKP